MKKCRSWLILLCFLPIANLVLAYSVNFTKIANFAEPYNFNYAFKMDPDEHIAYLATITQSNNGSKLVHLWSMQEGPLTKDTPEHKLLISDDFLQGLVVTEQNPNKLHLAIHYDQSNNVSNQYISYIDQNKKNLLVILQRYPCTPTGNYCIRKLSETVPIGSLNAFDMAVQKDGNLLVTTVDNTSHVHLYKYITQFYGTAPEPITLIGQDSQLIVPWTSDYGQFKLVLVGPKEIPHVVFPSNSTNSQSPEEGRMATAYVESKTWSNTIVTHFDPGCSDCYADINTNRQIDAIALPNDTFLRVAYITTGQNGGIIPSRRSRGFGVVRSSGTEWDYFCSQWDSEYIKHIEYNYVTLATDGESIYGVYAEDHHAAVAWDKAYTAAKFFNITNIDDINKIHFDNISEIARKDYDGEIKYTGLVMQPKNYTSYYKGLALAQDGNSNDLVISGLTFY